MQKSKKPSRFNRKGFLNWRRIAEKGRYRIPAPTHRCRLLLAPTNSKQADECRNHCRDDSSHAVDAGRIASLNQAGIGVVAVENALILRLIIGRRAVRSCSDRQGSDALTFKLVIGLLGRARPLDGVRVLACAHLGLAAGYLQIGGFALKKTLDLAAHRKRGAVIHLGCRLGGHRIRGRLDDDGAGLPLDVQPLGDVDALGVDDGQLVDLGGHGPIGDVCRRGLGAGGLHRVALGQAGHGHVDAVGLAVVGARVAAGGRDDLAVVLGDGELAEVLGDLVVRRLGGGALGLPVDGVRVDALADGGLGAGGREGRGLAVHEALDGALGGQGLAVVGPLGARRGDLQGGGLDDDVRRGFQGLGLILDGHVNLYLNRIRTCIFVLGCDIAPRFTAIGAVLNCALLDEVLSLVLILLSKIASLVDGDINRRKAMLFAVISVFIADYVKACPQRVKGVSLSTVVNISNGVAGFPDGGRLISTFLVKPTNKRLARGSGFALGYLDGVTLCKTIVVVPLLLVIGNSVCGGAVHVAVESAR